MATTKHVKVVIDGEEYVSDATQSAEKGMDGFLGKSKGWLSGFADLRGAWEMLSGAVARVWGTIQDSLAAYDELATSQRKLEGAAKLTGLSLEYLQSVSEFGRKTFQLSRVTANEFAVEMGKLEKASGGAAKATDLLSGFLEIGAARGMSSAESLQAAQQALLGIDEGTDKLFGKNPSGLWADYEAVIGKSAGKFTDMEKQAALAYAVLQGGNATVGSYQSYLESAQGQQALFNERFREAQSAVGGAIQPLRAFILDTLNGLIANTGAATGAVGALAQSLVDFGKLMVPIAQPVVGLGTVLVDVFATGLSALSLAIQKFSYGVATEVGRVISSFGTMVEKGGDILKVFGITVVANAGESLKKFGDDMANTNQNKLLRVEGDIMAYHTRTQAIVDRWRGNVSKLAKDAGDGIAAGVKSGTEKATATVVTELGKQDKEHESQIKRIKAWYKLLDDSVVSYKEVLKTLNPEVQKAMKTTEIEGFNKALDASKKNADDLMAKMKQGGIQMPADVHKVRDAVGEAGDKLGGAAQKVIDLGDEFGGLDKGAQTLLTSVKNIGDSIGAMSTKGLSFVGVAGLLGGVATIVSTIVNGNKETRRITRENTEAIDKMRRDGVPLITRVSGETIGKVTGVADEILSRGPISGNLTNWLPNFLLQNDLRMSDLDALAEELGIQIRDKDGAVTWKGVQELMKFVKENNTQLTSIGRSFSDQLDYFQENQDINGVTGLGKVRGLLNFLANDGGSSALAGVDTSDPVKMRAQLMSLFNQLQTGGISASAMGRLTPGQFRELVTGMIRDIDSATGSESPSAPAPAPAPSGTTAEIPGLGEVEVGSAAETVQQVITANGEKMHTVLTEHTGYLTRIADATEGTYATLQTHTVLLEGILQASSDKDRTNVSLARETALEATRRGG